MQKWRQNTCWSIDEAFSAGDDPNPPPPDEFLANAKFTSFDENDCVWSPGGAHPDGVPGDRVGALVFFLLRGIL
jgi:hypothetical protein